MKISLVLHGQGAYGFEHIPIIKVFESLRLKPSVIARFSINLIINVYFPCTNNMK